MCRKAHTYVLIKKYRELRASGFAGYKLQAALRLNLASSALHRLHNEAAKRVGHKLKIWVIPKVNSHLSYR